MRDDKLKGFVVRVGKNRKTYRVELERRTNGKRTFISKKLGEHPYVRADDARRAAMIIVGKHATGIVAPTGHAAAGVRRVEGIRQGGGGMGEGL